MLKQFKTNVKTIYDFILRHSLYIALILIGLYLIEWQTQIIKVALIIIIVEAIAIGLSGLAVYTFTNYHLTEKLFKGEDNQFSIMERGFSLIWAGLVFLGVHILSGLIIFSTYLSQFAN